MMYYDIFQNPIHLMIPSNSKSLMNSLHENIIDIIKTNYSKIELNLLHSSIQSSVLIVWYAFCADFSMPSYVIMAFHRKV